MIVLGVDPGIAIVGFGVVRVERGKVNHIGHGVIRTKAGLPVPERLRIIDEDFNALLDKFEPETVAVEELYFGNNVTTGIHVAHARGVLLLALGRRALPMHEYGPSQVKQAVVGYGKAEKAQVMEMTRQILGLNAIPRPDDAADALAVAICHGATIRYN